MTDRFFRVLGVPAAYGRTPADDRTTAVVSRRGIGELIPDTVGDQLTISDRPYTSWLARRRHSRAHRLPRNRHRRAIRVALVEGVPFTRAYPPGHAKLKTRWQFYLLGMWAIAYLPVRMEQAVLNDPSGLVVLMAKGLAVLGVLEIAGRYRARQWVPSPESRLDDADPEALTFLNLGPDAGHNPQPAI